ncbi:Hsp20/alpha crystallin family protein [Acidobacteriota bacterium]
MKKEIYPGILIQNVQSQMDQILRRLHSDAMCCGKSRTESSWYPQLDIYETAESIIVLAECSGVAKEELEITLEDKILTLRGRRRDPLAGKGMIKAHNMEITFGTFKRTITIDITIDREQIAASYENGFLTLTIPKVKHPPKTISVKENNPEESES